MFVRYICATSDEATVLPPNGLKGLIAKWGPPMAEGARVVAATDQAYDRLREQLTQGQLLPGQRLVEADLVDELGVSRAVVRSVLSRLAHEGLLEKEPNRGARVRRVSEAEAVEITEARSVLEALAARYAAERATAEDVDAMRTLLAEMKDLLAAGDLLAYSDCNSRLHGLVVAASRHGTAQQLIANLRAQMVRFQYRTILVPGRAAQSLSEHTALVDAVSAHDPEAAEAAMRAHLAHVSSNLGASRLLTTMLHGSAAAST
jgi:DNA-binding GntR family transcriptional regulator